MALVEGGAEGPPSDFATHFWLARVREVETRRSGGSNLGRLLLLRGETPPRKGKPSNFSTQAGSQQEILLFEFLLCETAVSQNKTTSVVTRAFRASEGDLIVEKRRCYATKPKGYDLTNIPVHPA